MPLEFAWYNSQVSLTRIRLPWSNCRLVMLDRALENDRWAVGDAASFLSVCGESVMSGFDIKAFGVPLVLLALSASRGQGQETKPDTKGIDAATVAAYEKLGARYGGWVKGELGLSFQP